MQRVHITGFRGELLFRAVVSETLAFLGNSGLYSELDCSHGACHPHQYEKEITHAVMSVFQESGHKGFANPSLSQLESRIRRDTEGMKS
jgi:hypothetical protein